MKDKWNNHAIKALFTLGIAGCLMYIVLPKLTSSDTASDQAFEKSTRTKTIPTHALQEDLQPPISVQTEPSIEWINDADISDLMERHSRFSQKAVLFWDQSVEAYNALNPGQRKNVVAYILLRSAPDAAAFTSFFMLAVGSVPAEKKHHYPQSFNELLAARDDLDLTFNIYRQLIQTNEMHKENFGLRHVISDQLLERYSVLDAISVAKTEAPESSFEYLETSIAGAAATNKRQELVQLLSTNDAIFSNSAVSYIALQLGYEAPKSIENIVASIAEKRNDYSVTQGYVRSWSTIDSMASAQWLAQLPAGIARDGGILGLLESFEPDERLEREDLLQWKNQIKDTNVIREADRLLK